MPLAAGTRLGGYEIVGPLGGGGMGEVYRARDSRLGRDVAIKLLPEGLAKDATRVARFEREARLLASLNHPAIGAIYGFEESGDQRYLVLELVPGQTLKDRLERPMALKDALSICRQIAEGLEAAHEKGIVHRDLKPANVMVTPLGKVKVLDLGLAKAMDVESSPEDLSQAPTAVVEETLPGVILGTVGYMSPEQARGKPIDKRTDIWAFGCILFECLTGRRAFSGASVSDVIASILRSEPEWPELPPDTPPDIRDLLARCLEKDMSQRLRDIGDARLAIEGNLASSAAATRHWTAPPRRRRRPPAVVLAAAAAALALGILAWAVLRTRLGAGAAIPARKYIAVLPFRDLSGLADGKLVGDGLVETVSSRLGSAPDVQVVSPAVAVAAADKEADPYRAAGSVGANLFVRGSVQRSGDRVRITYSVWNTSRREEVAGGTLDGTSSDLFDLQDKLIAQVVHSLKLNGPPPAATTTGLETSEQQERYLKAVGLLQHYNLKSSVDDAIRVLEPLAAEVPKSAVVQASLGRAYLDEFDLTRELRLVDRAIQACRRARDLDPTSVESEITLGELMLRTGKSADAVQSFQTALSRRPESYEGLIGLGKALATSGRSADAEKIYRRAIDLQPANPSGYSKLGGFYYGRGDYPTAAKMFQRVTEISPGDAAAWNNLGAMQMLRGDIASALDAFNRSLALSPTASAYSNIGTAQFYLGRFRASVEAFEKTVALTPDHSLGWANLADAYRWTEGMKTKAVPAYERAIGLLRGEARLNPSDVLARAYLAACLAKTGRMSDAEVEGKRALSSNSPDPQVAYLASVVSCLGGKPREALDRLHRALDQGYPAALLARDPELASLRDRTEFQEILAKKSSGSH